MAAYEEPSVRGRLNQLVQMFENRATQREDASSSAPVRSKKLPASKLQSVVRDAHANETVVAHRRVDTSMFSVNKLIETFDTRPGGTDALLHPVLRPLGASRKCQSSGDLQRKERTERSRITTAADEEAERYPEVKDLVEEIFSNIVEKFHRRRSFCLLDTRWSGSARDLMDEVGSVITHDDDEEYDDETFTDGTESCTSPGGAASFMFSHEGGKIGALWTTRESFQVFEDSPPRKSTFASDVSVLCTKKLSQYMDILGARLALDGSSNHKSAEDCRTAIKDTMKLVMSKMEEDAATREEALCNKSTDVSVRTCKALIEMTVFEGETLKPTINVINRPPCQISADDDDDLEEGKETRILFSTDDLELI